jgi:hypothetical protein
MQRRGLLAALPPTTALVATTGCLTRSERSDGTTDPSTTDPTSTPARTTPSSTRATSGDPPADAEPAAALDIDQDVLTPDDPDATATGENARDDAVRLNLAGWAVRHDGEVAVPERYAQPRHSLEPSESHSYVIALGGDPTGTTYSDVPVQLGDVASGEYVFELDAPVDAGAKSLQSRFRVEADAESEPDTPLRPRHATDALPSPTVIFEVARAGSGR